MSYVKLHEELLSSSVWSEPDNVRLVWITMLVKANKHGEVMAAVPGLARQANVSIEACRDALKVLSSPDPDSRTKDEEGRRIVEIEGGWELLNYPFYRKKASVEEQREANRLRQHRWRERQKRNKKPLRGVTDNAPVTPETDNAEAEAESRSNKKAARSARSCVYLSEFEVFWKAYPKRVGKADALKAWKQQRPAIPDTAELVASIEAHKRDAAWQKEGGQFIPYPATWIRRHGWLDEINGKHIKEPLVPNQGPKIPPMPDTFPVWCEDQYPGKDPGAGWIIESIRKEFENED